jgi:hypothetical protein
MKKIAEPGGTHQTSLFSHLSSDKLNPPPLLCKSPKSRGPAPEGDRVNAKDSVNMTEGSHRSYSYVIATLARAGD